MTKQYWSAPFCSFYHLPKKTARHLPTITDKKPSSPRCIVLIFSYTNINLVDICTYMYIYIYVYKCIYIHTQNFTKLWCHIISSKLCCWVFCLFDFVLKIWHAKWFKRKVLLVLYYAPQTFLSDESFDLIKHSCVYGICVWWEWRMGKEGGRGITGN